MRFVDGVGDLVVPGLVAKVDTAGVAAERAGQHCEASRFGPFDGPVLEEHAGGVGAEVAAQGDERGRVGGHRPPVEPHRPAVAQVRSVHREPGRVQIGLGDAEPEHPGGVDGPLVVIDAKRRRVGAGQHVAAVEDMAGVAAEVAADHREGVDVGGLDRLGAAEHPVGVAAVHRRQGPKRRWVGPGDRHPGVKHPVFVAGPRGHQVAEQSKTSHVVGRSSWCSGGKVHGWCEGTIGVEQCAAL